MAGVRRRVCWHRSMAEEGQRRRHPLGHLNCSSVARCLILNPSVTNRTALRKDVARRDSDAAHETFILSSSCGGTLFG
jgi:hypothetical protein